VNPSMSANYTYTYSLVALDELSSTFPERHLIPSSYDRRSLEIGDKAKLVFRIEHNEKVDIEQMWVKVVEKHGPTYCGNLDSQSYFVDDLDEGFPVSFDANHIIGIKTQQPK
jgi:hypothetical protein